MTDRAGFAHQIKKRGRQAFFAVNDDQLDIQPASTFWLLGGGVALAAMSTMV